MDIKDIQWEGMELRLQLHVCHAVLTHTFVPIRPVIPNLGYVYPQGYEPGHLGAHEKIE
jgi:hypothetical protein